MYEAAGIIVPAAPDVDFWYSFRTYTNHYPPRFITERNLERSVSLINDFFTGGSFKNAPTNPRINVCVKF